MCGSFEKSLNFNTTRLLTVGGNFFLGLISAIRLRSEARRARSSETTQHGDQTIELEHVRREMPIRSGHKGMDCVGIFEAMPRPDEHQTGELDHSHKLKPIQNRHLTTELDHAIEAIPKKDGLKVIQVDRECNLMPTPNGHQNADLGHLHNAKPTKYTHRFKIINHLAMPIWRPPNGDWATHIDNIRNPNLAQNRHEADRAEGIPNQKPKKHGHLATTKDSAVDTMPIVIANTNYELDGLTAVIRRLTKAIIGLRLALVEVRQRNGWGQRKSKKVTVRGA